MAEKGSLGLRPANMQLSKCSLDAMQRLLPTRYFEVETKIDSNFQARLLEGEPIARRLWQLRGGGVGRVRLRVGSPPLSSALLRASHVQDGGKDPLHENQVGFLFAV